MIFYSSYIIIQVNQPQCQTYLFSQGPKGLWKASKLFRIFGNSILFRFLSSSWVGLSSSSRGRSEGRRPVSQQSPGSCLSPPPRLSCHSHFWGKNLVARPAPNELYINHLRMWCFYHILFVFLKPRALSSAFCTGSLRLSWNLRCFQSPNFQLISGLFILPLRHQFSHFLLFHGSPATPSSFLYPTPEYGNVDTDGQYLDSYKILCSIAITIQLHSDESCFRTTSILPPSSGSPQPLLSVLSFWFSIVWSAKSSTYFCSYWCHIWISCSDLISPLYLDLELNLEFRIKF